MSQTLRERLLNELDTIVLIDPHTHIDPHQPAARTLADILGYHYYTELAHSAGMLRSDVEEPDLAPREKVRRLVAHLEPLQNTIQYSWLIDIARSFFGFADEHVTRDNWEGLYDAAQRTLSATDWPQQVLRRSGLEAVLLTNDFDDPLEGWDTSVYVPCLRTDDLVFRLHEPAVGQRLAAVTGVDLASPRALREALARLFTRFTARHARACAISLPPGFTPIPICASRAETAWDAICRAPQQCGEDERQTLAHFVFWTLAELCADFQLPFDLMIGVHRGVYRGGVYQGQDLYDSRVSLIQYGELFNAFPQVTFPVSVLASVANQELTSYAWIFPNVVTSGHWWYSNTPAYIEHDLAARLEVVPGTKQIGYYSDMYKLEFGLPKFRMYKRVLAKVLAERFVIDRGWSETRALELGRQVLRGNVDRVFGPAGRAGRPRP
ncbi:MAG: amidohydrolase [Planctomycetaceae bacterium]|nr:amidohydrolase [Planctomycetaceae bacterium]